MGSSDRSQREQVEDKENQDVKVLDSRDRHTRKAPFTDYTQSIVNYSREPLVKIAAPCQLEDEKETPRLENQCKSFNDEDAFKPVSCPMFIKLIFVGKRQIRAWIYNFSGPFYRCC